MHGVAFLQDLAVVMIVAGLVTVVFHHFKQPVVLGYILAGAIIGPHMPPFPLVRDQDAIRTLAELGVVLLMFSLGLEFNLRRLHRVGVTALLAAALEILLMVILGYGIGRMLKWSAMDSLFLGAMLSISSTTIIVRALAELGKTREPFAGLIFGILIIEDILAIVMIALLSGIAMTGALRVADVGVTVGKLALFLAAAVVAGLLVVPRLLAYVGRFKSDEMLLVTVLGLCFGSALLAARLGYSVALGAFIMGAVIAEAREIGRIEVLTAPVRDMFSAIFFVAIGLMIDPALVVEHWRLILLLSLAVVVGKTLTCALGAFVGGHDRQTSWRVGMGMAQIGEFSFIIASLGLTLKVTSEVLYPIAVAVSAVTTLVTPFRLRRADAIMAGIERLAPRSLLVSLDLYTRWVGDMARQRHGGLAAKLMRRWSWQMTLNGVLIGGVFAAAAWAAQHPPLWLERMGLEQDAVDAALWLLAVVVALPLFIATIRKLQAVGLLVAETKVNAQALGERAKAVRHMVAQVVSLSGTGGVILYGLLLSSALLPALNVLLALGVVVALITWLLWRSFIRVYATAQAALQSTLSQPPAPRQPEAVAVLSSILSQADVQTIRLAPRSVAAGQLIREVQLRTRTGASIVGLERNGVAMINPGPDEELQAGDQVLLLGNAAQLAAARAVLEPTDRAG
jgi:CPA2 family monovalent cation:H+ antiporter-2